jgi:hypothetical protein
MSRHRVALAVSLLLAGPLVSAPAQAAPPASGFTRMFPALAPYHLDRTDLRRLGSATGPMFDANLPADEDPTGRSGDTYFGQFVDHDFTKDPITSAQLDTVDPESVLNGRTPQFDLDSVYGGGPDENPELYDISGRFILSADGRDHQRRADGSAVLVEGRNDENRIVGQIHVAVERFHNALIGQGKTFDQARAETVLHYQWVLLNDFLPRIADPAILAEEIANKPNPGGPNGIDVPLEVTAAAYRWGHSAVRRAYRLAAPNNLTSVQTQVFRADGGQDLRGGSPLPANLVINWPNFVQVDGQPGPVNIPRRIDPLVSSGLFILSPAETGDDGPIELPARNLIRGDAYDLPSGQAVAAALGLPVYSNAELGLTDPRWGTEAPLWAYVLGEAKLTSNGEQLGPVGSTLVARTFVMLLTKDNDSLLHPGHKKWKPTQGGNDPFTLGDFLQVAGVA